MKLRSITLAVLLLTFRMASIAAAGESAAARDAHGDADQAQDATLFPVPKLAGSVWERERLLGTLGGPRQTLAGRGVQIDFNMTHTFQSVLAGGESQGWSQRVSDSVGDELQQLLTRGLLQAEDSRKVLGGVLNVPLRRRGDQTLGTVLQDRIDRLDLGSVPPNGLDDSEYQGTWRLELKLDTGKMGLWPGGFVFVRAEQNYGRNIDARSGALLPPNVNATLPLPGLDEVTVPHLYFTQFLSEHVAIVVGKMDVTGGDANEFAHITGDERFIGSAFAANPTIAMLAPYSPLGAAIVILPTKDFVLNLSVIDGDGTATRSGFDTMFEGKTSYIAEGRLTTHFGGKVGHQLLGAVLGNGSYGELDQNFRAFIPGSRVPRNRSDSTWALYYNFDQYLWNVANDPTRGIGIFGRVGIADEKSNPIAQFYSFGIGGKGACPSRPHERFGIGWYYMKTSDDLPDYLHLGDEQGLEVFYNYAVTPAFLLTADLQVTDSAKDGIGTAVIGGLRATLRF